MVFQTPSRPRWLSRGSCLWFVWLSHKLVAQLSGMQTVPPQSGEGAAEGPVSLSSPVVSTAARTGLSLTAGAGGRGAGGRHTAPLPRRGLLSFWRHQEGPQGCSITAPPTPPYCVSGKGLPVPRGRILVRCSSQRPSYPPSGSTCGCIWIPKQTRRPVPPRPVTGSAQTLCCCDSEEGVCLQGGHSSGRLLSPEMHPMTESETACGKCGAALTFTECQGRAYHRKPASRPGFGKCLLGRRASRTGGRGSGVCPASA